MIFQNFASSICKGSRPSFLSLRFALKSRLKVLSSVWHISMTVYGLVCKYVCLDSGLGYMFPHLARSELPSLQFRENKLKGFLALFPQMLLSQQISNCIPCPEEFISIFALLSSGSGYMIFLELVKWCKHIRPNSISCENQESN